MMSLVLDAVYVFVAAVTAPWWARKTRDGWGERFGQGDALPAPSAGRKRLLVHAVSVGEVNLVRPLVERLTGEFDVVVSASTDTGLARARALYTDRAHVVRYPLDASWAVRRFLGRVRPDAVVLAELELWPNFLRACERRGIPVGVVNGRLSERSFRGYRRLRPYLKRFFGQLEFAAVQDEAYAARFAAMGVAPTRVHVAGTMKWDAADLADSVPGADDLAREMGIDRTRPLIVAGSTAPDEHDLLHGAAPAGVQLLCAPRKPEWFDDAARRLSANGAACARRSAKIGRAGDRFLLDTIGELRKAYALADVVVVGRSFGDLYGSDPMEAAALGKPVVIGPSVGDFAATVNAMRADGAIVQTTRAELPAVLRELLGSGARRGDLGDRARVCVMRHRGATDRHAAFIRSMMDRAATSRAR